MRKPSPPVDLAAAAEYLSEFPPAVRQKGEAYWREGRVQSLVPVPEPETGVEFRAIVRGSCDYEVSLTSDPVLGLEGYCSCPMEFDCKHTYAALKELLATFAEAQDSPPPSPAQGSATAHWSPPTPGSALKDTLVQKLRRPLKGEESKIFRLLEQQWYRVRSSQRITGWELNLMGLDPEHRAQGRTLELPWPPPDLAGFLPLLVWALQQWKIPVPKFLQPLAPDDAFHERIEARTFQLESERWHQILQHIPTAPPRLLSPTPAEPAPLELRLRFDKDGAVPEWMPPGKSAFRPLKRRDFEAVMLALEDGRHTLPPGSALIWSLVFPRHALGRSLTLDYLGQSLRELRCLIGQPDVANRLVGNSEAPLRRPTQPLAWRMTPPASDRDRYYRLRLVQSDGQPLPACLAQLEGDPTYYLTADSLYTGPACPPYAFAPDKEQAIPATAVESSHGLLALNALQVPLPERLQNRISIQPVRVTIRCLLVPSYPNSPDEVCLFEATARSADRVVHERWTLNGWLPDRFPNHRSKSKTSDTPPTVYQRAAQEAVPALLAQLPLKNNYQGRPVLAVTRKFPQIFLDWLQSVPQDIEVQLEGELASLRDGTLAGQVRLQAQEVSIDWFDLQVVVDTADAELTPEELKLLLAQPGQPVRLDKKGWRRLTLDLTPEQDQQLARLGLSPHELTDEPQRLHALQLADDAAHGFLPSDQVQTIQRRAAEIRARVTPPLPDGIRATLRPYQIDGFHFLAYLAANRFGGILADDMGLGKTLQTLSWIAWLRQQPGPENESPRNAALPSLVVCPKSVMDNWRQEVERFTPGLQIIVWRSRDVGSLPERSAEADVHVLNYAQLRLAGPALAKIHWLAVVLDEGQFIKNPKAQTAQAARRLQARYRLILSGTPIENRLLDLWSLMSFAMPGILGSSTQFRRLYDAKNDPLARQRLAGRVRPFLLRRTKRQVAQDLPDRVEEDLYCELEGTQHTLYQAELKRARQRLLNLRSDHELNEHRFHFLTSLLRLRQICCHAALVNPEANAESAKFNALLELLEPLMAEGNKVLVFSQFVGLIDLLEPQLRQQEWKTFRLTGETENRGDLVRDFQATDGAAVLLLSLKAGSFGLNLTAASYVVLFDPWWNPAVENQAIDRTHRIGQDRTVIAYRLLIKNSIEEKVRLLQTQKRALAEDILGEERFAQALSLDDLRFLLAD